MHQNENGLNPLQHQVRTCAILFTGTYIRYHRIEKIDSQEIEWTRASSFGTICADLIVVNQKIHNICLT